MLSDVMLPPRAPQPSVIEGSTPVVSPTAPTAAGEFTTIRKTGFVRPKRMMRSRSRAWIAIVCPMPPYSRISRHRWQAFSQPSST